jgi:1-acyl-sn-glycerol-3-phosphate acyltransferase
VIEQKENFIEGPAIFAIRHESIWETLILIQEFNQPIFILKKELLKIPLFGAMAKKVGTISIDRDNGARSLINIVGKVSEAIKNGHPVIIFPEGTRMASGETTPLKRGIALLYKKANCPVVPVIHNAGQFWPRHGFIKKPGIVVVRFLPPIAPGLSGEEFMNQLNDVFCGEVEKFNNK